MNGSAANVLYRGLCCLCLNCDIMHVNWCAYLIELNCPQQNEITKWGQWSTLHLLLGDHINCVRCKCFDCQVCNWISVVCWLQSRTLSLLGLALVSHCWHLAKILPIPLKVPLTWACLWVECAEHIVESHIFCLNSLPFWRSVIFSHLLLLFLVNVVDKHSLLVLFRQASHDGDSVCSESRYYAGFNSEKDTVCHW